LPHGVTATISGQPAAAASVTVITAVETSGAVPPGTYTPTRWKGSKRSPTRAPWALRPIHDLRRLFLAKAKTFLQEVSMALCVAASTPARSMTASCAGLSFGPPNFAVSSISAASPRLRMSAMIAVTVLRTSSVGSECRFRASRAFAKPGCVWRRIFMRAPLVAAMARRRQAAAGRERRHFCRRSAAAVE
jgi:hypothetical protein